ncbi:fasciclin-like arabinogalactan protein [Musa troglodytarum]|uniref:Fasciclin-like arabinogalactan protein n=1 Tax=Musa troglodytarum TaxID=320322 RepID=A0A9E7L0P5_9LILI|nr:fasciclin-like arabinogalactan protein [Musa troglodytarum]
MASKPLAFLLLLVTSAAAFDVKEILDPLPNFSAFTKYLTDLKLVDVINSRQTVTVLVVDNTAISPISSLPADKTKTAISAHILLDYYDPYIFDKNLNKSALLPTLAGGSATPTTQAEAPKTSPAARATPPKSSSTTTAALAPKSSSTTAAPAPTSSGATPTPSAAPKSSPAAPSTTAKAPKASATTPVGAPKASTPASSAAPKASAASPVEGPSASAAVDAPEGSAGAPAASVASPSSPTAKSEETSGPAGETTTPSSSAGRVVAGTALGLLMGAAVLGAI